MAWWFGRYEHLFSLRKKNQRNIIFLVWINLDVETSWSNTEMYGVDVLKKLYWARRQNYTGQGISLQLLHSVLCSSCLWFRAESAGPNSTVKQFVNNQWRWKSNIEIKHAQKSKIVVYFKKVLKTWRVKLPPFWILLQIRYS